MVLHLDDRLLHGRILHGWALPLGIRRFVLVSARQAAADRRAQFREAALPRRLVFVLPGDAAWPAPEPEDGDFWLCDSLEGVEFLLASGPVPEGLILIGLREGGTPLAADIAPSKKTGRRLEALSRAGLAIEIRPFPGAPGLPLPPSAGR